MKLPSITEITEKAQGAFKRFPVALLWAIIGTIYIISIVDSTNDASNNEVNIILTLILGVSWLIGFQFFLEQLKKPKKWQYLHLVLLLILFLFYWHLPEIDTIDDNPRYLIRFFLYLLAGHLFLLFAPFLYQWDRAAYWNYLKSVAFAIVRSGIFAGVLYLGLIIAISAVEALFEVEIDGDRYLQVLIFCIGIVNTWIYLSDFPKNIHQNTQIEFNKALEVLVKYILIPLIILYFIILYAYGFKIVFEWELPKGWVSYLVTALALIGFIIQVIINPIQKKADSWAINQFYPWFYRLLLPLVFLLFIAIFRRISDYGITENRYFVVIIAFWILGISLFLLLSKKKSLIILPLSLFILAICSSFGFWGASSVSQQSQINRYVKVFEEVKANNKVATNKQYNQLKSILDYLNDRNSLAELTSVTGVDIKEIFKDKLALDSTLTYTWFNSRQVLDSLNVTRSPLDLELDQGQGTYYTYLIQADKAQWHTIADYEWVALLKLNNYDALKSEISTYNIDYNKEKLVFSLRRTNDATTVLEIPIREKLKAWSAYGNSLSDIDPKEMVITVENDSMAAKLLVEQLDFYRERDSIHINSANLLLFLKAN